MTTRSKSSLEESAAPAEAANAVAQAQEREQKAKFLRAMARKRREERQAVQATKPRASTFCACGTRFVSPLRGLWGAWHLAAGPMQHTQLRAADCARHSAGSTHAVHCVVVFAQPLRLHGSGGRCGLRHSQWQTRHRCCGRACGIHTVREVQATRSAPLSCTKGPDQSLNVPAPRPSTPLRAQLTTPRKAGFRPIRPRALLDWRAARQRPGCR